MKLNFTPSYNGLISSIRWRTEKPFAVSGEEFRGMYLYTYDEKYQIKDATWADYDLTTSWASGTNQYRLTGMDYDPNGNIKKLKRYSQAGMPTHDFDYQYNTVETAIKTNQLESIPGYSNYKYNSVGQMTEEDKVEAGLPAEASAQAGDQFVEYDVTGKVTKVYAAKNDDGTFKDLKVEFIYDDRGFRLAKKNYAKVNGTDAVQRTTWYIRDASGNVISIYEEDNVDNILTETEVPVYGSGKIGTYYPNQDGSTAYEITDHLGNVRALVRDNVEVYTATMEDNGQLDITNPRVSEMLYFENLFETEVTDSRMNHTKPGAVPTPDKAAYLYWVSGMEGIQAADKAVGPAIALKVNAGDKIDVETWVRYERKVNYNKNFSLATLTSLVGGSFAYTAGFEGSTLSQTAQSLNGALTAAAYPDDGGDDTRPFAYLNYIVYDKDMVYKNAGWLRVTDDGGFDPGEEGLPNDHEHMKFNTVNIAQDGYIYVWVSNQSEATKVWFDDLTVTHSGVILTQATDYGVWGDILREQKTLLSTYRHGYQGQFSEKDEETGWNHFELREYDPVIGRWLAPDPYGQYWNPYLGMGNNPTVIVDPNGGEDGPAGPWGWFKRLFGIGPKYVPAKEIEDFGEVDLENTVLVLDEIVFEDKLEKVAEPSSGVLDFVQETIWGLRWVKTQDGWIQVDENGYKFRDYKDEAVLPALPIGPTGGANAIKITAKGLKHVLNRHTLNNIVKYFRKSKFNPQEDIVSLINSANKVKPVLQPNTNYARVLDAGRNIGIDMTTGQQTSMYTVITNAAGELVTAHPGL